MLTTTSFTRITGSRVSPRRSWRGAWQCASHRPARHAWQGEEWQSRRWRLPRTSEPASTARTMSYAKPDVLIVSTDDEWRQLTCLYLADHDKLKTMHPGLHRDLFHPGDPRHAVRASLGFAEEAGRLERGTDPEAQGSRSGVKSLQRTRFRPREEGAIRHRRWRERCRRRGRAGSTQGAGARPGHRLQGPLRGAAATRETPQPTTGPPMPYSCCSHSESFGLAALEDVGRKTAVLRGRRRGACL